jgi:hypothetical protein
MRCNKKAGTGGENHESRRLDYSVVGVVFMTKLVLTAVSLIALLTVSGCVGIGKGKAPPDVLGQPIRDVETEYGCFGAVSPVPSMVGHALSVNEAVHPALLESTRESSIKLNADKRIYVVADWTKPESFQRRRNAGRLGTTSNRATYQTDVDAIR